MSFEGFPVEVSPIYEGERIRKEDMYVEFGGGKVPYKFELVLSAPMGEVEDESVKVVGPDLTELKEGESYPLGILIKVSGSKIEKDLEPVVERRIHLYTNYIEGVMHLNQRYDIWIRISKKSVKKGMTSLSWWGKALVRLFKAEMPFIEKMEVTFITDPEKVKEWYQKALEIYNARDARARAMKDEDVDTFYGCVLCQSFAPQHVCVIAPNRVSLCGALNWFDARAAANVDPKGPNFPIPKGKCIDSVKGEYEGVNEVVAKRSLGAVKRVYMYSMFGYPHTSCGCFECIAFYVPEVDGIGFVHRGFRGSAVNGLPFSTMAAQTGGGIQTEGFLGMGIEYFRSPKFFQADGGWSRVVWMPVELKERVKDAIPAELYDKIATEKEVTNVEELKKFLVEKGHPLAAKLKEAAAPPPEEKPEAVPAAAPTLEVTGVPVGAMPVTGGGIKVILQGAKISIKKMVIKRVEKK
ncbi:MAG: CO dehydrogenase/CO-methylating acetyl-CoA synthase complex subunit beta [Candidatus Nezhaarchaeota archaeon]|nr:CO dehydrogenase/CO-methylating acetyl-CoA synthase complex subunit beta [Candidatus Nezhaarchaeota archaeon]